MATESPVAIVRGSHPVFQGGRGWFPRTCSTTRHPTETKEQEMRSPQNTATTPARSWFDRGRLVGAAAIAFPVSGVVETAGVAGPGAQTYAAPIEEALAYSAANRAPVAIISGLVALFLPLLL